MSDSILHYRRTAESMADFMLTNGPPPRALSHGKQLKLKQQQFCEYFVHHGNAARAVREAGYSEKNASYQGCRLLRDSRVRAYVHELRQKYALETQWEMEDALDHLAIIYDCAMTDKNYNAAVRAIEAQAKIRMSAAGRLNTMAIKTLEQAPAPEAGALMMETNTIRRYTRPSPNRDDFLEDMSPETPPCRSSS
jgi:phage terminase small subunit